uniref:Hexose transporter 1 n=1 Tax=Zooxanthella nutricula TaxID=1333877 RepID=A0A7S2NNI1_9DINO
MVGIYQSNICLAIVGASVLNYLDHDLGSGWRWSLGVQVILGLATAGGLLFVGDTPRFLESVGRSEHALKVLATLRGGDMGSAARELALVRAELEEERRVGSATWSEVLLNPYFRNVVLLGCLFQFFQIITGINAIVSFGGTLFEALGIHGLTSALLPSVAFVIGNSIGSFVLVDRVGRRSLLIFGMLGMAVSMLLGGSVVLATRELDASGTERLPAAAGIVVIAMIFVYMFSFGVSWGFGAWLYISEIMPLRVRGKAVGLCTGVNWGPANVISDFVAPALIAGPAGPGGMLLFFGALSALVVPFTVLCTPETKGKTLEEITPMFRFASCHDFVRFVRGNLRAGEGMGAAAGNAAGVTIGKSDSGKPEVGAAEVPPVC